MLTGEMASLGLVLAAFAFYGICLVRASYE